MKNFIVSQALSTGTSLCKAIGITSILALSTACTEEAKTTQSEKAATLETQKTGDTQKTSEKVEVAAHNHEQGPGKYQKPGANIRLGSPEALSMAANSSEQFEVNFSTANSGTLTITAKPKEGLSLESAGTPYTFDLSQETPTLNLALSSGEDGTYHVMFHASIEDASGSSSRVFGIPVYVGKPNANKLEKPANTSGVVIMKAEETVR